MEFWVVIRSPGWWGCGWGMEASCTGLVPLQTDLRKTRIFLDCVDITRSNSLKARKGNPSQTDHLPSSDRGFPCLNVCSVGRTLL